MEEEEKRVSTEPDEENNNDASFNKQIAKGKNSESIFKAQIESGLSLKFLNFYFFLDKTFVEVLKNLNNLENNEDKMIKMHDLVVNQRKTIDNLSKVNQELTTTVMWEKNIFYLFF